MKVFGAPLPESLLEELKLWHDSGMSWCLVECPHLVPG